MKKQTIILFLISLTAIAASCVTSKTIESEKRMEEWLSKATLPVTVRFQSNELRCKPSLNCYTLVDAKGKIYYAQNVRHFLPRVIPEDSTTLKRTTLEEIFLGRR